MVNTDNAETLLRQGLHAQQQGRLHEAAAAYERVLMLRPEHAGALFLLGEVPALPLDIDHEGGLA